MRDEQAAPEELSALDLQRLAAGLERLPCLTRAIFLMHRCDNHSYEEIAWRCGISTDEVMERMIDTLSSLRRARDRVPMPFGRIRQALRPLRGAWYRWRRRRSDRLIGL